MIVTLTGKLAAFSPGAVVVEVGGIGYQVLCPASCISGLPRTGSTVELHTHLHVREDALTLYGFASAEGRDLFEVLIGVNGVGPKLALGILSCYSPDGLRKAVMAEDVEALTLVPGVGKKTAARIMLELKEKLGSGQEGSAARASSSELEEARAALVSLGYTVAEARAALDGVENGQRMRTEELVRGALRRLGSR